jgi:ribosomal protein S18 acetylase RimI-like enzyme
VWEENLSAVGLYESFGFRRIGTTSFAVGAHVLEDAVMLLDKARSTT